MKTDILYSFCKLRSCLLIYVVLKEPIQRKLPKFSKCVFFFPKEILSSLRFKLVYKKNIICQREVCLPATEAFAFSIVQPDISVHEVSHSIKAWYWLRFYRVIKRFLSLSQYFFTQFCLLYNLEYKKTYIPT